MFWFDGVFACLSMSRQTERLDLERSIQIALDRSYSIRIARSIIDQARFNVRAAKGGLGPNVDVDAALSRSESHSTGQGNAGGQGSPTGESKQLSVGANLPIDISGNLRRAISLAQFNLRATESDLNSETNLLKQRVRLAYFSFLQTQSVVRVFEEALKSTEDRLVNAKKLLAAGTVAKIDVVRAEAQVAQARSELIAAQNRFSLSRNAFNNVLGRSINEQVELTEVREIPSATLDPDLLEKLAVAERPEVNSLQYTIRGLEVVREGIRKGNAPNLNLGLTSSNNYFGSGFRSGTNSLSGGVFVAFRLFDSGVARAKADAALEQEKQARFNLEQLGLTIALQVRQAVTNLDNAKARFDVATKQVELATENYRLSMVRYLAGEGIQLETIDAQADLTRARVGLETARYDYLSAWADLQQAIGRDDVPLTLQSVLSKSRGIPSGT